MTAPYVPKRENLAGLSLENAASEEVAGGASLNVYPEHLTEEDERGGLNTGLVHRTEIPTFGDEGFLLKKLFHSQECKHYIDEAERIGFAPLAGVNKQYRNCERVVLESQDLADVLWKKVRPFVSDIHIDGDPHEVHIHGVSSLLQGTWAPCGVNKLIRLCRYHPCGHFAPHFDGHLVVSSDVRSMQTLMLYLNGDFEGGTTNFVDEAQALYMDDSGKYCAEDQNRLYRVTPEPGMAIVFNHHRLHEGEALRSGVKYILRTDILYQRQGVKVINPQEEEALQLAQEAERLEAQGDNLKAMELYRRAFKMSPEVAAAYGN